MIPNRYKMPWSDEVLVRCTPHGDPGGHTEAGEVFVGWLPQNLYHEWRRRGMRWESGRHFGGWVHVFGLVWRPEAISRQEILNALRPQIGADT